jgi:hypothetical protein
MVSQHDAPLTKADGNDTHFETVAWPLSNQTHLSGAGGERLVILCKTGVRTLPYLRAGSADVLRFGGKEKETYGFQLCALRGCRRLHVINGLSPLRKSSETLNALCGCAVNIKNLQPCPSHQDGRPNSHRRTF